MVLLFLAKGFEEIEALATVDILRRAGLTVVTVGVDDEEIIGAHGITVKADCRHTQLPQDEIQAVVLPGGLPGTTNLEACAVVHEQVEKAAKAGALLCAICAAPSILGHKGLLEGKRATCYPGYESHLHGACCTGESVTVDGNVITAKGAGVSADFALAIVSALTSPEKARELGAQMQCR